MHGFLFGLERSKSVLFFGKSDQFGCNFCRQLGKTAVTPKVSMFSISVFAESIIKVGSPIYEYSQYSNQILYSRLCRNTYIYKR